MPVCYVQLFSFCLDQSTETPSRIKKDLEQILTLQTEIDGIHGSILKAKMNLKHSGKSSKPLYRIITALENSQAILRTQVDELYASLDVIGEFPELHGINLTFLWTLLLARDLKTKIRTKAVGSFFEWERLDRAVGGRNIPLSKSLTNSGPCSYVVAGTKLHQATRNAITK